MKNIPIEDTFGYKHPNLIKNLKNKDIAYKYRVSSKVEIECYCDNCGFKKFYKIYNLVKRGFTCNICSKNISFPERLMTYLLQKNNISFETQKTFDDCRNVRPLPFDFYLPEHNILIEMQGEQHYYDETKSHNLFYNNDRKKNDNLKRKFAYLNKIDLVEINCVDTKTASILNFIKNSTVSFLIDSINLNEIELLKLEKYRYDNIEDIIKDYKAGVSFLSMEKKYNISRKILVKLLKNLNIYTPREGSKNNAKQIVCLNNKTVYNSLLDCANEAGLSKNSLSNISACCRGNRNYSGYINNEPAKWMYLYDYIIQFSPKDLTCNITDNI